MIHKIHLIKHQVVVVLQHVISGDSTTCRVPDDRHTISSLKVSFNQLVITSIAQHHTAKL